METLSKEKENDFFEEVRHPANRFTKPLGKLSKIFFVIVILAAIWILIYQIVEIFIPLGVSFASNPNNAYYIEKTGAILLADIIVILIIIFLKFYRFFLGLRPDATQEIYKINLKSLEKLKQLAQKNNRVDITLDAALYRDKVALQEIFYQKRKPMPLLKAIFALTLMAVALTLTVVYIVLYYGNPLLAFLIITEVYHLNVLEGTIIAVPGLGLIILLLGILIALEFAQDNWNVRLFKRRVVLVHLIKDFLGPMYAYDKAIDPKDDNLDADDLKVNVRMLDYYLTLKDLRKVDAFKRFYLACPYCKRNVSHLLVEEKKAKKEKKEKPAYEDVKFDVPIKMLEIFDDMTDAAFSMDNLIEILDQIAAILDEEGVDVEFIKAMKKKLMKIIYFSPRTVRNDVLKLLRAKLKIVVKRVFANQMGDLISDLHQYDNELNQKFKDLLNDGRAIAYKGRI